MYDQYWQAIYQDEKWTMYCLKEQAEEAAELLYNAKVSNLQKRQEERVCQEF